MKKQRSHWNEIVSCVEDVSQKTINCGSIKRRKSISYISDRLNKLEQFFITCDKINTLVTCNSEHKKQIGQLIKETKLELNGDMFDG